MSLEYREKEKHTSLTSEGVSLADNIWDKVCEQPVRLIHSDGRAENLDLKTALERTQNSSKTLTF